MSRILVIVVTVVIAALFVFQGEPLLAQDQGKKVACDPFMNTLASLVFTGWGQWLNGEQDKAVMHLVVGLGLSVGAYLFSPTNLSLILGAARGVWGIYSGYDAFTTCARMHKEAGEMSLGPSFNAPVTRRTAFSTTVQ